MLLESQSDANRTRCPIQEIPLATELQALHLLFVDSRMPEHHRWRSRLISECRHAIRTRDVTHGMLQVARIESVSSVLRQKHTAVGEFRTHTSFENRLGGPTLNHLRYGDRPQTSTFYQYEHFETSFVSENLVNFDSQMYSKEERSRSSETFQCQS